jgi:hypothetical protein
MRNYQEYFMGNVNPQTDEGSTTVNDVAGGHELDLDEDYDTLAGARGSSGTIRELRCPARRAGVKHT